MHLLLTDRLACPRCGPTFGLILRADRLTERRVHDGALGCANCRDLFSIRAGFGDLRAPPRRPLPAPTGDEPAAPSDDEVERLAALLGAAGGGGVTLLLGGTIRFARPLAARVAPIEVVACSPAAAGWDEGEGVSRMASGPGLAFFDGGLRGVALAGEQALNALLPEAVRVLASGHRVVVLDPPADAEARMVNAGLADFIEGEGIAAAGR